MSKTKVFAYNFQSESGDRETHVSRFPLTCEQVVDIGMTLYGGGYDAQVEKEYSFELRGFRKTFKVDDDANGIDGMFYYEKTEQTYE